MYVEYIGFLVNSVFHDSASRRSPWSLALWHTASGDVGRGGKFEYAVVVRLEIDILLFKFLKIRRDNFSCRSQPASKPFPPSPKC